MSKTLGLIRALIMGLTRVFKGPVEEVYASCIVFQKMFIGVTRDLYGGCGVKGCSKSMHFI